MALAGVLGLASETGCDASVLFLSMGIAVDF